jgi:hypothetical protein
MLPMCQVSCDGAGKELLQASPHAAAAATDDDQFHIQNVG